MDFIALEDNELDDIFEIVNSLQMVFHPYYASEGTFEHYDEFIINRKNKVIFLDRNIVSMLNDYFESGELNTEFDMIKILFLLLFCNINRLQYNIGPAMNEYAEHNDNLIVLNQLNNVLNYLSKVPSMYIKHKIITKDYKFKVGDLPNDFNRDFNYKFKSDFYLLSYCSILKMSQIYLSKSSAKEKILEYLNWYYDNLQLSKYDLVYAILLFTNYPGMKAPKHINSNDFEKIIKGCKNQAWDISYLSTLNNFDNNFPENEYFFATFDNNLKLIFMGCNKFDHAWIDIIQDRLSKKDTEVIFNLIEEKSNNRIKPECTKEILTNLSEKLENELKEIIEKNK